MLIVARVSLQPIKRVIQRENMRDEIHIRMLPRREGLLPQRRGLEDRCTAGKAEA